MSHYPILHYTMACYTVRNSLAIKNSVWYKEIIAFKSHRYGGTFPQLHTPFLHMWVRVDC